MTNSERMTIIRLLNTLFLTLTSLCALAQTVVLPATTRQSIDQTDHHGSLVFADEHRLHRKLFNSVPLEFTSEGALSMHAWMSGIDACLLDSIVVQCSSAHYTYTSEDVSKASLLTDVLSGNSMELIYFGNQEYIIIEEVYSGFLPLPWLSVHENKVAYIQAASCEINASCNAKTDTIKHSVCRMLTGNEVGTGTLINNANEDMAPYVLTSAHPLIKYVQDKKPVNVIFGWEINDCGSHVRPTESAENMETIRLDSLLCYYPKYDLALFSLKKVPSEARNPYWSGWDITGDINPYDEFICVHHPGGDVKKVSVATNVNIGDYNATGCRAPDGDIPFARNIHYKVSKWLSGTTEGGSSGSALWNPDRKIIGALSGGSGSCSHMGDDYFWSLALAWDAKYLKYASLHEILDPDNKGIKVMTGRDLYNKESDRLNGGGSNTIDNDDVSLSRLPGSIRIEADSIKKVDVYAVDGRLLLSMKADCSSVAVIDTSLYKNQLIIVSVWYSADKKKIIKVFTI